MIKEIRAAIHAYLKTLTQHVHHIKAPEGTAGPYLCYQLKTYPKREGSRLIMLTVDGWDNNADSTALEDMMQAVNALDRHVIETDNYLMVFYLESYNDVPDPSLQHRQAIYYGTLM